MWDAIRVIFWVSLYLNLAPAASDDDLNKLVSAKVGWHHQMKVRELHRRY